MFFRDCNHHLSILIPNLIHSAHITVIFGNVKVNMIVDLKSLAFIFNKKSFKYFSSRMFLPLLCEVDEAGCIMN